MRTSTSLHKIILAALAALALVSCGGGGGGSASSTPAAATTGTGRFVDAAVEGLTYTSGGISGTTDASGNFTYTVGQNVTFKIGDVVLGTVTPRAVVTPVTLIAAASDETNATVTNIAKFLQSIDDDNNTANGIKISNAANTAALARTLNFAQSTTAFETDATVLAAVAAITAATTAGTRTMVSTATAQSHLRSNLLARLAGSYTGTYTGASSGTFSVAISSAGVITGSGLQSGTTFSITGTVASNGVGTFGSAGIATFSGTVNADTGALSGTWTSSQGSGTYSGSRL
jgi:hypothetical protein